MGFLLGRAYINKTLDASNTSATTGSIWLSPDHITQLSFQWLWNQGGGTLAATATYFGSNDPRARQDHDDNANADWADITSEITGHTDPTSGSGSNAFAVDNWNYDFVKVDVSRDSGSGELIVYIAGRSG